MITPEEVKSTNKHFNDNDNFSKLCLEIDDKLKTTSLIGRNEMDVIVIGEYSKELRDKIVEAYKKIGWREVTHITSSENDERPGLTRFTFTF